MWCFEELKRISIVLFGGSFDPFHYGHLHALKRVVSLPFVDTIVIMPTFQSPHKAATSVVADHRFAMLSLLQDEWPQSFYHPVTYEVSDYELSLGRVTWTYDTVLYLKTVYVNQPVYVLLGSDSFFNLHSWKRCSDLVASCSFVVVKRCDEDLSVFESYFMRHFGDGFHSKCTLLHYESLTMSSTGIRQKIGASKSIEKDVPACIKAYIDHHELYRPHKASA